MSLRRIAIGAALLLALIAPALPARAGVAGFPWPVESQGNRGSNVLAIQSLLRAHGIRVVYDGIYSSNTAWGVETFQRAKGLKVTRIVDHLTWARLVVPIGPGARGEAVLTLQRQLNEKRAARLAVTGAYDAATASAVRALEAHVGHPGDGVADSGLWRYLIAHYELPVFASSTGLCEYQVGNGPAHWGTGAAIGQAEQAGRVMAAAGYGRVGVGDVSLEHGGNIPLHATHELGLDMDVRPIRDNRDQCRWGTNWRSTSYDRTATRRLIDTIRAAAPGHVKLIYFNDPVLIREGRTTWYAGHDDHLHVRYCEALHAVATYRC
jgi:peptidoglycan hydrolase-like protein with peptidoglycan-binding domain